MAAVLLRQRWPLEVACLELVQPPIPTPMPPPAPTHAAVTLPCPAGGGLFGGAAAAPAFGGAAGGLFGGGSQAAEARDREANPLLWRITDHADEGEVIQAIHDHPEAPTTHPSTANVLETHLLYALLRAALVSLE